MEVRGGGRGRDIGEGRGVADRDRTMELLGGGTFDHSRDFLGDGQ